MKRALLTLRREPLVQFLIIGIGLFLAFGLTIGHRNEDSKRIVVSAAEIDQLAFQFSRSWMRPPTETELTGLIDNFVRGEVYYREAVAMGLDANDQVIRQRMRQKLELLMDDVSAARVPTNQELTAFLEENPDRYRQEPKVAFRQIYLNADQTSDPDGDATEILAAIRQGANPQSLGDRIMIEYEFGLQRQSQIARSFGNEFAQNLVQIEPGGWTGPVYSGLGVHVVQVTDRVESRMPDLTEIRDVVERDWLSTRGKEFKDAAYSRLLEGYEVVVDTTVNAK